MKRKIENKNSKKSAWKRISTLLSAIKFDILFQARHGFYYVYLALTSIYIACLLFIPAGYKEISSIFIIFSDPVMLGFIFIGAIILLEKEQDIYSGIFTTPYRIYQYFFSKLISLTILTLLSSIAIIYFSVGIDGRIFYLLSGITLSSIFFTLVGLFLAAKVKSINEYLVIMPVYMIIIFLPAVEIFGIYRSPIFYLFPSKAVFIVISSLFSGLNFIKIFYAFTALIVWIIIFYKLALWRFKKYILLRI